MVIKKPPQGGFFFRNDPILKHQPKNNYKFHRQTKIPSIILPYYARYLSIRQWILVGGADRTRKGKISNEKLNLFKLF